MGSRHSRRDVLHAAARFAVAAQSGTCLVPTARAQTTDAGLDALARTLTDARAGSLVRPGQADYARVRTYNARFDCVKPKAYIRPTSLQGVQAIVQWARQQRRPFAIRGGGHSFEGKSIHNDIVIDMSRMKRISFEADGTLDAEAGVLLGDVYKTLGAAGYVLPAGTCPTVGIVGHTLGGGIGDFLPMFGYAAQSLTAATIVTLSGHTLHVSDERIDAVGGAALPDGLPPAATVMKVLRGGGQGSLGIVTSMTFKAHDVSKAKLAGFKLEGSGIPAARAAAIIQAWQAWRTGLDEPTRRLVSSKLNLSRSGGFSIDMAGLIVIPAASRTTVADIRRTLDPLFRLAEMRTKSFTPSFDVPAAIKSFLDDDETTNNTRRRLLYGSSSAFPGALRKEAVDHLVQALPASIFASLYTSGGRSKAGPANSLHASEFLVEWTTYSARRDNDAHRRIRALNAEVARRAQFADLGFPNYPDNDVRDYFPNAADVAALRQVFDPDNLSTSSLLGGSAADRACR